MWKLLGILVLLTFFTNTAIEARPVWKHQQDIKEMVEVAVAETYEGPVFDEPPDFDLVMFDCYRRPLLPTPGLVGLGTTWIIRDMSLSLGSENLNQKLIQPGQPCAFALAYLHIKRFKLISSNPYVLQRRLTVEDKQEF